MRRLWWILILGALVLGLGYWALPAVVAQRFLLDANSVVQLEGTEGRVWNGRAQNLVVLGQSLGVVDWRIDPMKTLNLKPSGDVNIAGQFVNAKAQFAMRGEHLDLQQVQAQFPANLLGPALDIPALLLMGKVHVDLPRAQLHKGLPVALEGHVEWLELETGGAAALRLPGVRVDFKPNSSGEQTTGQVRDLGGPLDVQGEVRIEREKYRAEIRLRAREDNSQLRTALKYVGQPQADGSSLLIIDGQVKRVQ